MEEVHLAQRTTRRKRSQIYETEKVSVAAQREYAAEAGNKNRGDQDMLLQKSKIKVLPVLGADDELLTKDVHLVSLNLHMQK
jgi:hypothetical protein